MPMIIGYNSNEGLITLMKRFKPGNPNSTEIEYEYFVPQQMDLPPGSVLKEEICDKLRMVYSNDRSNDRFLVSIPCTFFPIVQSIFQFLLNVKKDCRML